MDLNSTIKYAKYYKTLGEQTFEQLSDEELRWEPGVDSNSIMTIVKHLWGNMLSRWTNFMTEDGEKSWRQRDAEFENDIETREEMLAKWNEGWDCFIGELEKLTPDDLTKTIYIRNEGQSVDIAIQRQMAHYPYHVGQIVLIGKIIRGTDWKSLSIPKGQSTQYNEKKFAEEKATRHPTDRV